MDIPVTTVPLAPTRLERKISATEAQKAAREASGGGENAKPVRVGLTPRHPSFSATYGPITFHKISERVSENGVNRQRVKGQIVRITERQVQAALDIARYKMVRAVGGWGKKFSRAEEYDVRFVSAGAVGRDDRPVIVYDGPLDQPVDPAKVNWGESLIYFENDPSHDVPVPETFDEAVAAFANEPQLGVWAAGGKTDPLPAEPTPPAITELMRQAKKVGAKITPAGEVR